MFELEASVEGDSIVVELENNTQILIMKCSGINNSVVISVEDVANLKDKLAFFNYKNSCSIVYNGFSFILDRFILFSVI